MKYRLIALKRGCGGGIQEEFDDIVSARRLGREIGFGSYRIFDVSGSVSILVEDMYKKLNIDSEPWYYTWETEPDHEQ